jgi:eukaryotic-like serine/threonine-protein kinase
VVAAAALLLFQSMSESSWLDNYNWLQPIGEGGMGSVYLAEDKRNGNAPCVIKQIKYEYKDLASQAEMIKVCQREADLLRKLNHRGIVKFLDDHYSVEGLYVVMEYIPGSNLEGVMNKEGPLDSETVVRIGLQCCDVLEYLHSAEPPIIYRDLKPSNLMLRPDGLVVFIDFGIARDFEPKGPATRVVTSGYSPPEQYFGKPEPRGDLYSLGATMHHLLTGVRPKPLTACHPAALNSGVLPALDALIFQMTSHDKDERPPSARAVQYELFRIYQSLHPDFEIPDLGIEEEFEEEERERREELRTEVRLRRMRNPRGTSSQKRLQSEDDDDTEAGGVAGLFARFKDWVNNITGRQ